MTILKFSTPSCCMCKTVSSILNRRSVKFKEVDCMTTEGAFLAKEHNILSVPAIIVTDDDNNVIHKYTTYPQILKNIELLCKLK